VTDPKLYRTDVSSTADDLGVPSVVDFSIDEETAIRIVQLASLVKAHGLYSVQMFDYRAMYSHFDLEDTEPESESTLVSTETDTLNVSDTHFWFSACLRNSDLEIRSEEQPIAELIEHFHLDPCSAA